LRPYFLRLKTLVKYTRELVQLAQNLAAAVTAVTSPLSSLMISVESDFVPVVLKIARAACKPGAKKVVDCTRADHISVCWFVRCCLLP